MHFRPADIADRCGRNHSGGCDHHGLVTAAGCFLRGVGAERSKSRRVQLGGLCCFFVNLGRNFGWRSGRRLTGSPCSSCGTDWLEREARLPDAAKFLLSAGASASDLSGGFGGTAESGRHGFSCWLRNRLPRIIFRRRRWRHRSWHRFQQGRFGWLWLGSGICFNFENGCAHRWNRRWGRLCR